MRTTHSQIVPQREEGNLVTKTIRLPQSLIDETEHIAQETHWSWNQVLIHLIRWAKDEHWKETSGTKRPK